jgi:hypothetical protein
MNCGCSSGTNRASIHRSTRFAIAIALAALPAAAPANQVHFRTVKLEEVIARATHVLVVKRAKPPTLTERIEITPAGKKSDPARYPPYTRTVSRYLVVRALRRPAGEKLPTKPIEVVGANDESELDLHRRYYVEKVSKSPIYDSYESKTSAKVGSAPETIVFLHLTRAKPPRFQLVVQGAIEPASEEARVKKALSAAKPAE